LVYLAAQIGRNGEAMQTYLARSRFPAWLGNVALVVFVIRRVIVMDEQSAADLADFLAVGEFTTSVCLTGDEEYGVDIKIEGVLYYTLRSWTTTED